ncbi:MAG: DUF350 domain-containing protein [Pseudomonadota bacterium]
MDSISIHYIINSLIFSVLGVIILIAAFFILDLITPRYHLWKEIVEKQNLALSILLGSFTIGIALIVAAAVHG